MDDWTGGDGVYYMLLGYRHVLNGTKDSLMVLGLTHRSRFK